MKRHQIKNKQCSRSVLWGYSLILPLSERTLLKSLVICVIQTAQWCFSWTVHQNSDWTCLCEFSRVFGLSPLSQYRDNTEHAAKEVLNSNLGFGIRIWTLKIHLLILLDKHLTIDLPRLWIFLTKNISISSPNILKSSWISLKKTFKDIESFLWNVSSSQSLSNCLNFLKVVLITFRFLLEQKKEVSEIMCHI